MWQDTHGSSVVDQIAAHYGPRIAIVAMLLAPFMPALIRRIGKKLEDRSIEKADAEQNAREVYALRAEKKMLVDQVNELKTKLSDAESKLESKAAEWESKYWDLHDQVAAHRQTQSSRQSVSERPQQARPAMPQRNR